MRDAAEAKTASNTITVTKVDSSAAQKVDQQLKEKKTFLFKVKESSVSSRKLMRSLPKEVGE